MPNPLYDLICVGFGPAAIALATTVEDWVEQAGVKRPEGVTFLERAPQTDWHGDFLLPGTVINHHYLRDLATPRNPRSRFTFASYLKEVGRLFDVAHLDGKVGRAEWSNYVAWAANQLSDYVEYNKEVVSIRPVIHSRGVQHLHVLTRGDLYLTRNVVIATGAKPRVPSLYWRYLGDRCFHTSDFLKNISLLDPAKGLSFLVVGSGQSAAESLLYLRSRFPASTVYSLHRGVGFRLKDTGHLSNAIYYPQETDYFYDLSHGARPLALKQMFPADYGTVNYTTSAALFAQMYEDKVRGCERIVMLDRRKANQVSRAGRKGSYRVRLTDIYTTERSTIDVDVVVLATGYYEEACPSLIEDLRPYLQEDACGKIKLARNYQIETKDNFAPLVFLCGMSERTHGISDTQSWSMMALKADLIFKTLLPCLESRLAVDSADSSRSRVA